MAHPSLERAIVVGLRHTKYGEVVGAFLERAGDKARLSDDEVREWTRETLGRHKAPAHIFWLGEDGIDASVPMTGSGKIKKYELRKLGDEIIASRGSELVV